MPRPPRRPTRRAMVVGMAGAAVAAATLAPSPASAQGTANPPVRKSVGAASASALTSPRQAFGFDIGADYRLVNYKQLADYWRTLSRQTDRMRLVEIGRTAEDRPQLMAIVSAPENLAKLEQYKATNRRFAMGEAMSEQAARALAKDGKAIVWIDGGLHATEVLGAHQLLETSWQLVSGQDEETRRFLRDCIILMVHANPDGHDLVSDWYMQEADSSKRTYATIPRLYQKYVGHDNNRDFYVANQPESRNMNRILYQEWFPQIVYNHHQTGPAGTVMFAPPFRDPFNYNYDPLVPLGIDLVGASMHNRFAVEDKPGVVMRSGASYSTWWNGGLRTMVYFHNQIGLLTETIGSPTPMEIPFIPQRLLPAGDQPFPIQPQKWHFRQSVDYSLTANRAVLDVASRHREQFLFNMWKMARNSIERGSRDTWTIHPTRLDSVVAAIRQGEGGGEGQRRPERFERMRGSPIQYYAMLREPSRRDARGYILSADQPDFPTAVKFANSLLSAGVEVQRATRDFEVAGKRYPAGSLVVKTAQPFRPHVLDMFEPQDHPNDFAYPGGPPKPPYDNAGYTLALQMGVQFDRVLDGFDGPFERVTGTARPPAPEIALGRAPAGWLLSHQANDAFVAVNRLLKDGRAVYWLKDPVQAGARSMGPGAFWIPAEGVQPAALQAMARERGLHFVPADRAPSGEALKLRPVRIGLWDRYGGSMPSGHTRWVFEQFDFPYEVVYPQRLDAGNLRAQFDVLLFVTGAIPGAAASGSADADYESFMGAGPRPEEVPAQYRPWLGRVTAEKTVPQLRTFLEQGGTVITVGTSTALARHLGLPVENHLVARAADGTARPLPREQLYIPGSILRARVDSTQWLAHGLGGQVNVFFDNSPVFRLADGAAAAGVRPVAWFDSAQPLRSGWAWGQQHLKDGTAIAEATVGRGKLILFGPEVTFRGQPHGTFKFLFNGIHYGAGEVVRLP